MKRPTIATSEAARAASSAAVAPPRGGQAGGELAEEGAQRLARQVGFVVHGLGPEEGRQAVGRRPCWTVAAVRVLASSIAIVIGPTPPGTGVIRPATSATAA